MKRAINIQDFLEKFNDEYKFLYGSNGTVCGEKEAVAFMFALDSMNG